MPRPAPERTLQGAYLAGAVRAMRHGVLAHRMATSSEAITLSSLCGSGQPERTAAVMSETALSRSIRLALSALGVWVIRVQSGVLAVAYTPTRIHRVHCAEPGTPDLCLPALGWLEVKTARGEPSRVQLAWHNRAAREGVRVAVVRSVSEAVAVARKWQAEARGTR